MIKKLWKFLLQHRIQVNLYLLIEIQVKPGDDVKKGQPVLMYEAMKMQNEIESELAGKVKRILVKEGQVVGTNDPLIEFED